MTNRNHPHPVDTAVDPRLFAELRRLGDDYGPLGVALAATALVPGHVVVDTATGLARGIHRDQDDQPAPQEAP